MAVLTQLTNNVRLYGTDCNQTEMVLHAIDKLEIKDMKIWLGVWIDSNETTSRRQIDQLYKIIDDAKDISILMGPLLVMKPSIEQAVTRPPRKQPSSTTCRK